MRKTVSIIFTVLLSLSLNLFSQEKPSEASSFAETETPPLTELRASIELTNSSSVENLTIFPIKIQDLDEMEGRSTLCEESFPTINFSANVEKNVAAFLHYRRVLMVGQVLTVMDEGGDPIEDFELKHIASSEGLIVEAQFEIDGEDVRKPISLEIEENRSPRSQFKAEISDDDLGLTFTEVVVENPLDIPFFLESEELDFSIVVDGKGETDNLFNSQAIPDGVHRFKVTMDLPIGMVPAGELDLRVKDGKIFFSEGVANPFDFGSHTSFSDKRSTVRLKNLRNEPITVLIPEGLVKEEGIFNKESANGGESSDSETYGSFNENRWRGVNVYPGETSRVNLPRGTTVRIVIQSQRQTNLANLRIKDRPSQTLTIGW